MKKGKAKEERERREEREEREERREKKGAMTHLGDEAKHLKIRV